jgi:hypothetical protein
VVAALAVLVWALVAALAPASEQEEAALALLELSLRRPFARNSP